MKTSMAAPLVGPCLYWIILALSDRLGSFQLQRCAQSVRRPDDCEKLTHHTFESILTMSFTGYQKCKRLSCLKGCSAGLIVITTPSICQSVAIQDPLARITSSLVLLICTYNHVAFSVCLRISSTLHARTRFEALICFELSQFLCFTFFSRI